MPNVGDRRAAELRFHHHPILALNALDQPLVNLLCRMVVKEREGIELTKRERDLVRHIYAELMEEPSGSRSQSRGEQPPPYTREDQSWKERRRSGPPVD
jgi:hypothetical protein